MAGNTTKYFLEFVLGADDKATAKISKAMAKWQSLSSGLSSIGKGLTLGVTAPLLAAGFAAGKASLDFNKSMGNVSTLIDTNTESLDDMGKKVLEIGKRTPVALEDLTGALYDIRSAGVSANDQFGVLEKSGQLAVSGLGTTKESVDLVTSSFNAFNLKGKEADRVYDLIFKTVKNGKTTISGLAQGFGAVAGTVAASGTELDEYLSAVAALTTTGQPAAQAHTQLKAVISGLTRDSKDTSRVFGRLGAKDLPDLIKKSGGLVPALNRVSGVLKGNNSQILKVVGSSEALNAIIGLTGEQAKVQTATLDQMRNGGDELAKAFAKQSETTAAKMQQTKNRIEAASIRIGDKLLPIAERVADKVSKLVDWFDALDDGTQDWVLGFAAIAAAAGPVLVITSSLINVVTTLRTVYLGAKVAMLGASAAQSTAAGTAGTAAAANAGLATSFWAMLAPIAAVTVALGAIALAWKKWNDLDKDLEGSGGISGTVDKMMEMGTFDPFKAHDAVLNDKAQMDAWGRETKAREDSLRHVKIPSGDFGGYGNAPKKEDFGYMIPGRGAEESKTAITVDFKNVPAGTRASVDQKKGQADVDLSMGYALPPGG